MVGFTWAFVHYVSENMKQQEFIGILVYQLDLDGVLSSRLGFIIVFPALFLKSRLLQLRFLFIAL